MAFNWKRGGSGALSGAAAGSAFGPYGAAAGAGLGALGGFGGSPEDAANKYYDQIPGQMKGYYDPYINAGRRGLGKAEGAYNDMMSDPNGIISRLGAGYKESPGYKWQLGQGEAAIGNANAAGGMAGTSQHMQQGGQFANDLANQDYEKYLNHAMNLYGAGVQGQQGLADTGYQGSSELAQSIGGVLMSQGNMASGNNANESDMMNSSMGQFGEGFGRYGNGGAPRGKGGAPNQNWWWGK